MTAEAALWMLRPRRLRIQPHSRLGIFWLRRIARGFLAWGARAAAYVYRSAIFCMSQFSVVVTR